MIQSKLDVAIGPEGIYEAAFREGREMRNCLNNLLVSFVCLICLMVFLVSCSYPSAKKEEPKAQVIELTSEPVQPGEGRPGLMVWYDLEKVRHIRQLPDDESFVSKGKPGKPIPYLDHKFGEKDVFDSGENIGVCMLMKGFMNFQQAGEYRMQANSNDGIRLYIDDQMVLNDPDVHSDRLSEIGTVIVRTPGWHNVRIKYFQRKGTATIQLFWKKPGDSEFSIIPADAYAH